MKLQQRISRLRSSAKSRGIPVRLMDYEYKSLLDQGCHYCGLNLDNQNGVCLDRVDSRKGYVLQNVVGCCSKCNIAKSDMHMFEFFDWVEKAYKFQKGVFDSLKELEAKGVSTDYKYKEEKDLRKQTKKEDSFCIKVDLSEEELRSSSRQRQ